MLRYTVCASLYTLKLGLFFALFQEPSALGQPAERVNGRSILFHHHFNQTPTVRLAEAGAGIGTGQLRTYNVMTMNVLSERLSRLPLWQGPVTLEPLLGGLTNISYVATDRSGKYVVRCGDDIPVHHVFRDRECAAARAAFEAGLSPGIVHVE